MSSEETTQPAVEQANTKNTIQLSLGGLIALSSGLVATTAVSFYFLNPKPVIPEATQASTASNATVQVTQSSVSSNNATAPEPEWGNLEKVDIDIEQPDEYVAFNPVDHPETKWEFPGMTESQVRKLMGSCGITEAEVNALLDPKGIENAANAFRVKPSDEAVMAISEESRGNLYKQMSQWAANRYISMPFVLSGNNFEDKLQKSGVTSDLTALVRKLSYTRDGTRYFSDADIVLKRLSDLDARRAVFKALTNQPAVLVRMKISPRTDIDRILSYWTNAPGVQSKDLKPLLESLSKNPVGGTVSLLYFLPPFARERLYTFPLQPNPGEPQMDCHWSALNFFNEVPDNRLTSNDFAAEHIRQNYYPIGKADRYGDLVFLLNEKGAVIHSAVYLAEDLVFTKNGMNIGQPWILMRIKNMVATYTYNGEPKIAYYRHKGQ
jgi:hypothetical protein